MDAIVYLAATATLLPTALAMWHSASKIYRVIGVCLLIIYFGVFVLLNTILLSPDKSDLFLSISLKALLPLLIITKFWNAHVTKMTV